MKVTSVRERVHQPYYDALIQAGGFILDTSPRDAYIPQGPSGEFWSGRHDPIIVTVVEDCWFCRAEVEEGKRCDHCGATAADRRIAT